MVDDVSFGRFYRLWWYSRTICIYTDAATVIASGGSKGVYSVITGGTESAPGTDLGHMYQVMSDIRVPTGARLVTSVGTGGGFVLHKQLLTTPSGIPFIPLKK